MAEKREWEWSAATTTNTLSDALWAIVERLEALVQIGDNLEEVYDVIANHLTFGGQPVGDMTPTEAFEKAQQWKCKRRDDCTLFNGHGGDCVHTIGAEQEESHGESR